MAGEVDSFVTALIRLEPVAGWLKEVAAVSVSPLQAAPIDDDLVRHLRDADQR